MFGVHPFSRCRLSHTGSGAEQVRGRSLGAHDGPMMGPCWSAIGALMHHYKLSRGVNGVSSKANVFAVDAGVSGWGGVYFGGAEVVYSNDRYREEKVPEIRGEGGVNSGEDEDEVIFVGSYGALGEVGAIVAGRLELGVNLVSIEEIEERL